MSGGLYDPVGIGRSPTAEVRRGSARLVATGIVVVAVAAAAVALFLRSGDERGEPQAIVKIEHVSVPAPVPAASASPPAPATPATSAALPSPPPSPGSAATESGRDATVEIQNGVRIVRMRSSDAARTPDPAMTRPPAAALPSASGSTAPPTAARH